MLQPVTERIHGIAVVRPGSVFFVRSLSIRPTARQLRARYNSVYAQSFDATVPAKAHQVAEDAVILVAEAVLNARLTSYVTAHDSHEFDVESAACLLAECTGTCIEPAKADETVAAPKKARQPRKPKTVAHSSECADICVCTSQR